LRYISLKNPQNNNLAFQGYRAFKHKEFLAQKT
jgi:hypothetical protein